ncbi:MAG: radical SAM protein, partial [Candidatus Limnocylindrales bacterium]
MTSPAIPIVQPSLAAVAALPPGISGRDQPELSDWFVERGEPAFRAKQVLDAVWRTGAPSPESITTLKPALQAALAEAFRWDTLGDTEVIVTEGGLTEKALHRLDDGVAIESVLMRYPATPGRRERATLCVSSQAGCAVGCPFCATGELGFGRDLQAAEILDQVRSAARRLAADGRHLTNIVFMGMGEPLLNLDRVLEAV